MRCIKLIMSGFKYILICVCIIFVVSTAIAHESNGFKHDSQIGPAIGISRCGLGVQLWWIDKDNDGEIDGCSLVIFNHGKFHQKEIPITNGECVCP